MGCMREAFPHCHSYPAPTLLPTHPHTPTCGLSMSTRPLSVPTTRQLTASGCKQGIDQSAWVAKRREEKGQCLCASVQGSSCRLRTSKAASKRGCKQARLQINRGVNNKGHKGQFRQLDDLRTDALQDCESQQNHTIRPLSDHSQNCQTHHLMY